MNGQLDLIYFVYGLAFLLLAAICASMPGENDRRLHWGWLALFGLSHGLNEWLDLLALSLGDSPWFQSLRLATMAGSFLCLGEFARTSGRDMGLRVPGRWVYLPLLGLTLMGAMTGELSGTNAAARYSLGLTAGVGAAAALLAASRREGAGRWPLRIGAAAMGLYAIATGLIVPKAPFLLASLVHHDSFLATTGVRIQLIRGALACVLAGAAWCYHEVHRSSDKARPNTRRTEIRYAAALLLTLLLLLATGSAATQWAGERSLSQQRHQLVEAAQHLAAAIDSEHVAALAGNATDLSRPEYLRLKDLLHSLRTVYHDTRFVYVMRLVNGRSIFLADSEPAGSPDESPPGQDYGPPSPEFHSTYRHGTPMVEGPTTDAWGCFYTGVAALRDAASGQVVGVLGIDMDAATVHAAIAKERLVTIALTSLLCLAALLAFAFRRGIRDHALDPRSDGRSSLLLRWGTAGVVLLIGGALSLVAFHEAADSARDAFRTSFTQQATARAELIGNAITNLMRDLEAVRRFHEGSENVDAHEFADFTGPLVSMRQVVQAIASASLALPGDPAPPLPQETETSIHDSLDRKPAALFPVVHVEPRAENMTLLGIDLAAIPEASEAMDRARDTGVIAGTGLIAWARDGPQSSEMLAFAPLYAHGSKPGTLEERRAAIAGFIMGVYRPRALVENACQNLPAVGIALTLEDMTTTRQPRLVAQLGSASASRLAREMRFERLMQVAGRPWRFIAEPGKAFIANEYALRHWWVLASGLGLTLLLATHLNSLMSAHLRSEAIIRQRTAELAREKEHLNVTLRSIGDGLIATDAQGRVTMLNGVAEALTGWTEAQALGHPAAQVLRLLDDATRRIAPCPVARAIEDRRTVPLSADTVLLTHDGAERAIEHSCAPVLDAEGEVVSVVMVFRDITERMAAEEALRESRDRYALAARGTNDGLWDWDLVHDRVYYAQRTRQLLGIPDEEPAETPQAWQDRIDFRDLPQFLADLELHLTGQTEQLNHTHRITLADGSYRWLLCRGVAVRNEEGEPVRMAGSFCEMTKAKEAEAELRAMVHIDKLTGLAGRELLQERITQAIQRRRRSPDHKFALLFLDLDRFKVVNDSLGHEVGDLILAEVARRLREDLRHSDLINAIGTSTTARLGGDEFVVLLDGLRDYEAAAGLAQHLVESLNRPHQLHNQVLNISVSIGVVTSEQSAPHASILIRHADTAMYEAKRAGKGRFVMFDNSMGQRLQARLSLEADLRRAVEGQQLLLHYQPIVAIDTGQIEGFEALVRWKHPVRGLISPGEFIPIAEESGIIVPVGEWVLRDACRQIAQWTRTPGLPPIKYVSVNLSRRQLVLPGLIDTIGRIVAEAGIDPGLLCLEVTESTVMHDVAQARSILQQIRGLGIRLAMDDFGTGHSSLACLHQFPLDVLKIDRSFVCHIDGGRNFVALIAAIVALGNSLGMRVVAEGVETADQIALLQSLDCWLAQGYYFSKPLPADAAEEFLRKVVVRPAVAA